LDTWAFRGHFISKLYHIVIIFPFIFLFIWPCLHIYETKVSVTLNKINQYKIT
jgi:hypothetical protein